MRAQCVAGPDKDSGWLCGIQARDRDALEQVYRNYSGRILHFLSLVAPGQSAEEACLDVFEELWRSAAESPPRYALSDWLFCLAYRVLRKRASAAERCSSGQLLAVYRIKAMEALTLEQRVVVGLVYGMGLPRESISRITGMSGLQITVHLSEAREHLRREATESSFGL